MRTNTPSLRYRKKRAKAGFIRTEIILSPEEVLMLSRAQDVFDVEGKRPSQQRLIVQAIRKVYGRLMSSR